MKRMKHIRLQGNDRGQATVEYLLLMAVAFITTYLVITGPMGTFTQEMVGTIRAALVNVVQNGELTPGEVLRAGDSGHPGDPVRLKPLHM